MSWAIYLAGVVIALAVMRDPWRQRLPTALAWPLGPIAFVVVLVVLLVAAAIMWPLLAAGVAAAAAVVAWIVL